MDDLENKINNIIEILNAVDNEKEYAYVFFSVSHKAFLKLGNGDTADQMKFVTSGLKGEIVSDRGIA